MIEPKNELELIIRFAQEAKEIGFEIISCDGKFPDSIVSYENKEYRVEFEYKSKNFWLHKHNPLECDLIICWIDDDDFSVLPVLELSNPDWIEHGIEKIPSIERNASYWKRRALEAEEQNHSNTTLVLETEILESYSKGLSYNQIALNIMGSKGGHQTNTIKEVVTRNFEISDLEKAILERVARGESPSAIARAELNGDGGNQITKVRTIIDQHKPTEKQEKILRLWDAEKFEGVDSRSIIGKIANEVYVDPGGRQRELVEKTLVKYRSFDSSNNFSRRVLELSDNGNSLSAISKQIFGYRNQKKLEEIKTVLANENRISI